MTRTGAKARPDFDDRTETALEWVQLHSRAVTIGAVVVVVVLASAWFYVRSRAVRATAAAQALSAAVLASDAGNLPLAQNDLEQLIARYPGTVSAADGELALVNVLYRRKQYQAGVDRLLKLLPRETGFRAASAYALLATGYEDLGHEGKAAGAYQKAAGHSAVPADSERFMADAARALSAAGDASGARRIWQTLANDPASPEAAEARIRLGELEAAMPPSRS